MNPSRRKTGIYGHRRSGVWLVQPMCPHPLGGEAEIGQPLVLEPPHDDGAVVRSVLEALRQYGVVPWDPAAGRKYDRPFIREHDLVEVAMLPEGTLEIIPARHERGGYHGSRADMVVLTPTEIKERLTEVLRQAMETARTM